MWSVGKLKVKLVQKRYWFSKYFYVSADQICCFSIVAEGEFSVI